MMQHKNNNQKYPHLWNYIRSSETFPILRSTQKYGTVLADFQFMVILKWYWDQNLQNAFLWVLKLSHNIKKQMKNNTEKSQMKSK